jgi:UDP-glucose 4-epimerase
VATDSALITGGAGFIGSHLAESLLKEDWRVTIIDDLSTGQWSNLAPLESHPNLSVVVGSAADRALLEREVPRHDLVYHLASSVGVKLIVEQPVKTVENTFTTTDSVLSICARYRRPVLITSSSEVYGKSTAIPFKETDDVVMGPTEKRRWAYACAKALDEFLGLAHFDETQLPVFIVRLFNTVGPRQTGQYGMVLPTFVRQALAGEPLTVYGDGQQQRCFCAVSDIVEALRRVPTVREAAGRVINLGSQEETSILALAQRVIRLCDASSEIQLIPYDQAYAKGFDDMARRVPDLTRAKDLLGWSPRQSLDDIIRDVATWMR